ncbi:MAG: DUF4139 domain-containing protein [Brumimicrobium sp.]|nr:DUF4139 domain-containing protein [Brumimicrobium sp.]
MKNLFIGIVMSMSLISHATEEEKVDSKIKDVTVYLNGAQIHRTAEFSVKSGVTDIVIGGLSRYIDAKSIQIKSTGGIIILDTKFSTYYPQPDEEEINKLPIEIRLKIDKLTDSISEMNYTISNLNSDIEVLKASKAIILNSNAMRGQGKVNDSIPLLKEAVEYYQKKVREINHEIAQLERKQDGFQKKKGEMENRLRKLHNFSKNNEFKQKSNQPDYRITVKVSSTTPIKGLLDLNYLVSNAGWTAQYDLQSSVETKKINLNYKAEVYQSTGVDWENVRLNISTNDPYKNKTKPDLQPWYLGEVPHQVSYNESNAPKTLVREEKAKQSMAQGYNRTYNDSEEVNFDYSTSAQHTRVVEHMISAEFQIDLPYTIKSTGEKHMVLVKNEDVDADFVYYTVPKLENSVYLVAQITNLESLQLIPAKANIFFDGSYMGETFINPGIMEDTLSLSLGRDPNIIVKRTFMKKKYKEKIIGNEVVKTSTYEIEILNNKSRGIKLIVQDQIPVSRKEDIVIEAEELSKGSLNPKTGIIEWKFDLKSKGKEIINLEYTVKHHKDQPLVVR